MSAQVGLERCVSFIRSQLQSTNVPSPVRSPGAARLAVTISRECGAGGRMIAQRLADYLQAHAPQGDPPWKVVDRNLVEQVLQDHHLPQRLARFMPEDRISEMAYVIDELLGVHPSSWTLVEKTASTILRLAKQGNVILVGRAAHVVTHHLQHVFHVRLVGSLPRRCQRIQEIQGLGKQAALRFIQEADRGRKRYLKKHFSQDAEDAACYHLVINTDFISYERAARMIGDEVLTNFPGQATGAKSAHLVLGTEESEAMSLRLNGYSQLDGIEQLLPQMV